MQNQTNNKSVCQQQAWSWMACAGTSFKRPTQIEDHLQCLLVTTSAKVRTTPTQQHVVHDYNVRVSPAGEVACCPTVCCLSTCFRKTLVYHDPRSIPPPFNDWGSSCTTFQSAPPFNWKVVQPPSYHTSWMPQAFLLFYRDLTFLEKPRVLGKCWEVLVIRRAVYTNEQHGSAFDLKILEMIWNSIWKQTSSNIFLSRTRSRFQEDFAQVTAGSWFKYPSCSPRQCFKTYLSICLSKILLHTYLSGEVFNCSWKTVPGLFWHFKKSALLRPQRWQSSLRTSSCPLFCFWCEMWNACCVWCHDLWDLFVLKSLIARSQGSLHLPAPVGQGAVCVHL